MEKQWKPRPKNGKENLIIMILKMICWNGFIKKRDKGGLINGQCLCRKLKKL